MGGYISFTVQLITLPVAYSTYMGISKNQKDWVNTEIYAQVSYWSQLFPSKCSGTAVTAELSLRDHTTRNCHLLNSSISATYWQHLPCSCDFFSETRINQKGPKQASKDGGGYSHVFSSHTVFSSVTKPRHKLCRNLRHVHVLPYNLLACSLQEI
jgi:hypothetical protein